MKKIFSLLSVLMSMLAIGQNIEINDGLYYQNNKLYKGIYKEYNASGNLSAALSISKGKLDGKTILYFDNRAKKEQRSYRNGLKQGLWITWGMSGNKSAVARYKADLKHGKWCIWDEKGHLRYLMHYSKGKKTGTWRMWDENGALIMEKSY